MKVKKLFLYGAGAMLGLLCLAQLVPYGRAHTNPPVVREPSWDSPRTRELAVRACFDCHSHETRWPWYSNVAPVSWLVQRAWTIARSELEPDLEWLQDQQDVGEDDRGVDTQALHGRDCYLCRGLRVVAELEKAVALAHGAILRHIAAGLAHEPNRRVGRLFPAARAART